MEIDDPFISRLEKLAKLKLSASDREMIKGDLSNILGMINTLQEVDTEGVEPLIYINENEGLREDIVVKEVSHKEAMQNSPDQKGPYFKVPKVLNV